MKHQIIVITALILALSAITANADFFECDDKILPGLADIPGIGPKMASSEDAGDKVKDAFKEWGCKFKKGASDFGDNFKEKTKQWSDDVRESFKKLKDKSIDLHTKFETKFHDFKDHLSKDSAEFMENKDKKFFLENVEIINPDILKADQECGHGHLLDSLGNCRKLRK